MLSLLVTGASGFVGSNFIVKFHKKYKITALVREDSRIDTIRSLCDIYRHNGDITSLESFCRERCFDGVIHLATLYKPNHTLQELQSFLEANIIFGTQLLESLKRVPPKFFINTLTFSQFANATTYCPASLYDATKEAFYDILQYYALEMPTVFTHLLLYNTYGLNDNRPKIFNLWRKIAQTKEVLEMSAGEQLIDISHIDDVISGFDLLVQLCNTKEAKKNQIYTLENERYTLRELAKLYEKYTNLQLNIQWGAKPYRNREIMNPISSTQNHNLMKLPTWSPKISLQQGLQNFIGN